MLIVHLLNCFSFFASLIADLEGARAASGRRGRPHFSMGLSETLISERLQDLRFLFFNILKTRIDIGHPRQSAGSLLSPPVFFHLQASAPNIGFISHPLLRAPGDRFDILNPPGNPFGDWHNSSLYSFIMFTK